LSKSPRSFSPPFTNIELLAFNGSEAYLTTFSVLLFFLPVNDPLKSGDDEEEEKDENDAMIRKF
jgi:hypothetical protein